MSVAETTGEGVALDEPRAGTELEPDTTLVTIRPVANQSYGSIIQPGSLDTPVIPPSKEAP